jgi:mannosylglycerate hydrolase MGH1-like protein
MVNAERRRLDETNNHGVAWRRWGPYLSDRQWGMARAYHWGEDGLAGLCDDTQQLCLALSLWNGHDPILKGRLFGLTNAEGDHGEDVKECYFYLDATPTSSYQKMLYKYPQAEFPYADLIAVNAARGKSDPEYELLDTGIFDRSRYFDVVIEYAKATPEDLLMQVSVYNRGPEDAELHVLPTLWFRDRWSRAGGTEEPSLREVPNLPDVSAVRADHGKLGSRWFYADQTVPVLVTGNETTNERVFGSANVTPHVKDDIDRAVVHGERTAVNPAGAGTKAALHYKLMIRPGGSATVRMRLADTERIVPDQASAGVSPFADFDELMDARRAEADEFWADVLEGDLTADERMVVRQALAGMLWSKPYYALAMPDTWQYPWFAAWDLAFHAIALTMVDAAVAKQQIGVLLNHHYLHPGGQPSAYERNFGDINPAVHAWAALFIYKIEEAVAGKADRAFLEDAFRQLMQNFGWWLNRKDADDLNIFRGGFLGLDNTGVFDQADGTAWVSLYCQNMMQIALELAAENPLYLEHAHALLENFLWIATATDHVGPDGTSLWNEQDGFFYDVLRRPDGSSTPLKVRSIVGLMPLAAAAVIGPAIRTEFPGLVQGAEEFLARHPGVTATVRGYGRPEQETGPVLFALFDEGRLRRILARMLDEEEFLGPHGIRSVSRWHAAHPYVIEVSGREFRVGYSAAGSDAGAFGGHANWRGPVWFPINVMLIRALLNLQVFFGDGFTVECPTFSGRQMTLYQVAREISDRLTGTFLRDADGHRPVHGGQPILQTDPYWRDLVLFYEYFSGDSGAGIGASHQAGWTGTVALLPLLFRGFSTKGLRPRGRGTITGPAADRPTAEP